MRSVVTPLALRSAQGLHDPHADAHHPYTSRIQRQTKTHRRPLAQLTSARPHMPTVRSTPTRRCISILHPPRPPARPAGSVKQHHLHREAPRPKAQEPWSRSHGTATSSGRSALLMPQQSDALQQPDAAATTCSNEASAWSAGLWAHSATTRARTEGGHGLAAQHCKGWSTDRPPPSAAYATLGRRPCVSRASRAPGRLASRGCPKVALLESQLRMPPP